MVILGGMAAAGFGIYSFYNYLMAPANTFFIALSEQGTTAAYTLTSNRFQEQVSLEKFTDFVHTNNLDHIKETHWNSANVNGDTGITRGSVELKDGSRMPVTVNIIRESGLWKIHDLKLDDESSRATSATSPTQPSSDEAKGLKNRR